MVIVRLVPDVLLSALDLFRRTQRDRSRGTAPAWIDRGRSADPLPVASEYSISQVPIRCACRFDAIGSLRLLAAYLGLLKWCGTEYYSLCTPPSHLTSRSSEPPPVARPHFR